MLTRSFLIPILICLAGSLGAQDQQAKAKALVKEAVAFAKTHGKEALVKETSQGSGRFHVKGGDELYIFIYDAKGTCLAIGFQGTLVGMNRFMAKDPEGKYMVQEIIKTGQGKKGGWVDYKYTNPKNGKIEQKSSYVEGLDDWAIGCGIYK